MQARIELDAIEALALAALEGRRLGLRDGPEIETHQARKAKAVGASLSAIARCRSELNKNPAAGAAVVAAIQARDELSDAILAAWHLGNIESARTTRWNAAANASRAGKAKGAKVRDQIIAYLDKHPGASPESVLLHVPDAVRSKDAMERRLRRIRENAKKTRAERT